MHTWWRLFQNSVQTNLDIYVFISLKPFRIFLLLKFFPGTLDISKKYLFILEVGNEYEFGLSIIAYRHAMVTGDGPEEGIFFLENFFFDKMLGIMEQSFLAQPQCFLYDIVKMTLQKKGHL